MSLLGNSFENISTIDGKLMESLSKNKIEALFAPIDTIDLQEIEYIKGHLVEITKGPGSSYSVGIIAKKLYDNFFISTDGKKERKSENIISGLVAELFLIFILKERGFEQRFCYKNLEENSAKKGFDGLYKYNNEIWLVESKSSYSGHNDSHKKTIKKAYDGISNQLSGVTSNDPWENAANHSKIWGDDNLVKKLEQLSMDYESENYLKIGECNIILGTTLINSNIASIVKDKVIFHKYVANHKALNEKIVAINLLNCEVLLDILKEIVDGQ